MAWTIFAVPTTRKGELEAVLKDDQLSRQSQKVRDAASAGGPTGSLYVLVEGSGEAVDRANRLLAEVGSALPRPEAEALYKRFKDEEESASAGMGLFFTEG